mmetsp:Transcript_39979/g.64098  ORF Transcript_39979/g.64098 Transcript_39979/m.64098 type:complete len:90 (-) Transcript_39979:32-301(-)
MPSPPGGMAAGLDTQGACRHQTLARRNKNRTDDDVRFEMNEFDAGHRHAGVVRWQRWLYGHSSTTCAPSLFLEAHGCILLFPAASINSI